MSKAPSKERNERSVAMAERVATAVDIVQVRLVESHVKQKLIDGKYPPQVNVGRGARSVRDKDDQLIVLVTLVFDANDPDNASGSSVQLNATYELAYKVNGLEKFSDDELNAFGHVNGCYNAWPFWREYVYSTLARMGLAPLTLPTFRFDEAERPEKKEVVTKKNRK